jgi:uncharacterized membrane protein
MIEIIPNWHPIFVHYTIALLSISPLLFTLNYFLPADSKYKEQSFTIARWGLYFGTIITIGTLIAGWDAYNSVAHDVPSHAAMTNHKNWAFVTSGIFAILALWAFNTKRKDQMSFTLVLLMLIASTLLAATGYKGGELVYRYGLGVMSLPQSESGHGHDEGTPAHNDGAEEKTQDVGDNKSHNHEH